MHDFILNWKAPTDQGEHLIREFALDSESKCSLFYVKSPKKSNYVVILSSTKGGDYLVLSKLPFDLKYMVYYLKESVVSQQSNEKASISLKAIDKV